MNSSISQGPVGLGRGVRSLCAAVCAALLSLPPAAAQSPLPVKRQLSFENSPRVRELIRAGNLYLSLQDAIALAIENNLAVELERFLLPMGDAELLRASGGGTVRGLNYNILEVPTGVGGPLSQVVTGAAAAGRATSGSSVATTALALNGLGEPQTNLSMLGSVAQSTGTSIPVQDPSIVGQVNWNHTTTPQTTISGNAPSALVSSTTVANAGIQRGFLTGGQASMTFNNNRQDWNSISSSYSPFTNSSLGLNVTQPLLRGFGTSLNRRFIRIATNEQRITSLLFRQQLVATVYGVIRLYTDFVALFEDEKVKLESANLAEKLLSDVRAQVEEGTLAPVEMTRANAQVFSTRQDLINARGLLEESQAILKNVLTRTGNLDAEVRSARIIPTDTLDIPENDGTRPIQDLLADAANRPDVSQAMLQVENARIGLAGARSLTQPQVDLVGVMQNNGLAGVANPLSPNPNPVFVGGYAGLLGQVLARNYPTYGVGLQVTLPLRNRIAEADLARDELQVKQFEIRTRQLQNQARLEVEDALIAMRRARASYEAASQARALQQQSLEAEQAKFEVGASTSFFVIQYESLLAQAKSTEVAAKSSYMKARAALRRATGTILDDHNVSFSAAVNGRMQ